MAKTKIHKILFSPLYKIYVQSSFFLVEIWIFYSADINKEKDFLVF